MNERIKELAKQSGVYFGEAFKDYFGEEYSAFVNTDKVDIQKFAELIIKEAVECCTKVEEDIELADYEGGFRDGALLCRQEIKEHFGIE